MKTLKTLSVASLALMLWVSAPAQESAPAEAASSSIDLGFNFVKNMMIRSAEQMPEEFYDFRPAEEVRTFGEIVAHTAESNFMMWSIATGQDNPMPEVEATKEAAVEAIKKSYEILADARNSLTEAEKGSMVDFFGGSQSAGTVLDFSVIHGVEHYGNLIVYMRLKGLVPPSSQ